jgi:hypothetical protein
LQQTTLILPDALKANFETSYFPKLMSNCPLRSGEKERLISDNNREGRDIPAKVDGELKRNGEKHDGFHRYKLLLVDDCRLQPEQSL